MVFSQNLYQRKHSKDEVSSSMGRLMSTSGIFSFLVQIVTLSALFIVLFIKSMHRPKVK